MQPIVVTDSGAGGLFVLDKLVRAFPQEKFVYFSDVGNMPYGNKSDEWIRELCGMRVDFAKRKKAKLIVVACNTMSSVGREVFENGGVAVDFVLAADGLLKSLSGADGIDGVNGSGRVGRSSGGNRSWYVGCPSDGNSLGYVGRLTGEDRSSGNRSNGKIDLPAVVFCTAATEKSGAISRLSKQNGVIVYAERDLAREIEEHIFDLLSYKPRLAEGDRESYKTVVLGCTHYALIRNKFAERFSGAVVIDGTEGLENRVRQAVSVADGGGENERKSRGENGAKKQCGDGSGKGDGRKGKVRVVFFGSGARKMRRAFFALFGREKL